MKNVLVTGVSSGIGRGIASVLARKGWRVFGSVRKEADGKEFEAALGANATALVFDVTDEAAIATAVPRVAAAVGEAGLAGLVNNAGITVQGPLQLLPLDRLRHQLEVNVIGLVAVTQAFLPLLGASGKGRKRPGKIINISSVGGKRALPFLGPYNASKFAVEALTDSWRRELMIYGIDVIAIEPGAIQSEIWGKALDDGLAAYSDSPYAPALAKLAKLAEGITKEALPAEAVGELAYKLLENPRPKTRTVIQKGGALPFLLQLMLPDRLLDRIIAGRLGLKRRK
jgi:hypothetical protein